MLYTPLEIAIVKRSGFQHWENEYPEALIDKRVQFQGTFHPKLLVGDDLPIVKITEHNFFEPQPIKDASVFFLRFITHDWPNEYAKRILKHLGDTAQPSTKLVLMDNIVPYTVPGDTDIPGAQVSPVPYPLLANLGIANFNSVWLDLHVRVHHSRSDNCVVNVLFCLRQMMALHNSQERTIGQFEDLVQGTGWKLESISTSHISTVSSLVFAHIAQ
jgi:hypothetical protein